MEKWTKEEVSEVIENLPLQRKITVKSVLQHIPSILTVGVSGELCASDLNMIGEAFGDDNIWIQAVGVDKFNLTIVVKEKYEEVH